MEKLKKKWGIESNWQMVIIFMVFAITGSSSVYVAKPFLELINVTRETFAEGFWGGFLYYTLRLILIFPFYQVLLLLFGFIFGQFKFFWNFEKKMLSRMGLKFLFKE
ncbi:DUF6787 family protein [Mesonia sp. K7]|uniref:DUF6787 family protein n=1 Tax=Mesonia sp. K7 TaxID=2218606 RepID=UPI000DA92685|nr:DUF6787 family protein [Mesonia sp. K7]PZD79289.1 diacylglyceryl transferase [Mesonia sp. K7]